jgi:hypothetical protein
MGGGDLREDIVAMFGLFRLPRGDGKGPLLSEYIFQRKLHCETLVILSCDSFRFDNFEITRSVEYEDIKSQDAADGNNNLGEEQLLGHQPYFRFSV